MKNKIGTLKNIRRQIRNPDPVNGKFDKQFMSLSKEVVDCLEGVNAMQEKNWRKKGQDIIRCSIDESNLMNGKKIEHYPT